MPFSGPFVPVDFCLFSASTSITVSRLLLLLELLLSLKSESEEEDSAASRSLSLAQKDTKAVPGCDVPGARPDGFSRMPRGGGGG
jgi:hypothetical protein